MSSFIWCMIVFPTQRNSQMAGRELRDLVFSSHSSIVLQTVLHSTASYNAFSAGDVIWDGIRMQGINVWCLLIPKMYFSFDLIDVQLYTVKIWHPCIFSTKIWTSIKSSKKYIFGILKCHISTPCTQIPSQNPSPTYKPFKDTVIPSTCVCSIVCGGNSNPMKEENLPLFCSSIAGSGKFQFSGIIAKAERRGSLPHRVIGLQFCMEKSEAFSKMATLIE